MSSRYQYDENLIHWLECILEERFGLPIQLISKQNSICLKLPGGKSEIEIVSDHPTFTRSDSDLSFTIWDAEIEGWSPPVKNTMPMPGLATTPTPLIEKSSNGYYIHYDILGLTFWMLSRQEEIDRKDIDEHGRFPASSSHAYKFDYLERPIVDEWLHILGEVIQRAWHPVNLKQHRYEMKVSHDVDNPSRYGFGSYSSFFRAIASDVLHQKNFKNAARAPWIRINTKKQLHSKDPYNTFSWIMDQSEENKLTSAFYFICGRTDTYRDGDYEIEHPAIRSLMKDINRRGHEIGLHPSYNSFLAPEVIANEAERLKHNCKEISIIQKTWGGRMHYLRWENPVSMQGWEQAEMTYDSTLGYADKPGFRCGTCYEYPAFDPVAKRKLKLRIRPLIAMECTIIADRYMALGSGADAYNKFIDLIQKCRCVQGCFTLLWHNSHLVFPQHRSLYKSILKVGKP